MAVDFEQECFFIAPIGEDGTKSESDPMTFGIGWCNLLPKRPRD
jgi:hypothetical protein